MVRFGVLGRWDLGCPTPHIRGSWGPPPMSEVLGSLSVRFGGLWVLGSPHVQVLMPLACGFWGSPFPNIWGPTHPSFGVSGFWGPPSDISRFGVPQRPLPDFWGSPPDYVVQHWRDDAFFGAQYLNGVNPVLLRRCSRLPHNFAVTPQMVAASLGPHTTLQREMEVGDPKGMGDLGGRGGGKGGMGS